MSNKSIKKTKKLLSPGHNACAGCGELLAARIVAEALGPNIIIANSTGCSEVTTTAYPTSAWGMPWIHSLFENSPAVASGIFYAIKQKSKNVTRSTLRVPRVIAQGGDGATFDIGFGLLSGMWERNDDVIYICYDNEAYANTGYQASGATPWGANVSTAPAGKGKTLDAIGSHLRKKDMIAIALAHGLNYVAMTTIGYPDDITQKIKKAMILKGPSYIQILTSCVPGWKIESNMTIKLGKLAAQTGLYPIIEFEKGKLINKMKIPQPQIKVEEYLKPQGRFAHLFKSPQGQEQIKIIQEIANENIERYQLA
ncbi:MAG: thiamine pyrophosphate-dependent enzyme [Patescibacteria group bacterium]|nr:thiamine pyrophosphate-dependent enzyme [Patescibacteria group bacterium]MDD4610766.1 thiamine pyrophosphate-dependent enzyme [Patescibacteria group bacterium]